MSPHPRPPPPIQKETTQGFRLGYTDHPPAPDLALILTHLRKPPTQSSDLLGGRMETLRLELPQLGPVVIKHYARGGWMRYVSRRLHLRSWVSRAETEFCMLHTLAAQDLAVPRPVLWAESGQLLVHKWLITHEIPDAQTLAEIARAEPRRAEALLPAVAAVLQRLIAAGVHHVDFHPGNVLIDDTGRVFPIDFDKAKTVDFSHRDLAERYRRRWNRAVSKHRLPPNLMFRTDTLPSELLPAKARAAGIKCACFLSVWDPIFFALPL